MAPLVGAPVAGLPGPVPRLTVGGALTLTVPRPLALSGIAALALAATVRPAHLPTPFRCHAAALPGHAAGGSLDDGCYHYPGRRRIHICGDEHYLPFDAAAARYRPWLPYAEELRCARRAR